MKFEILENRPINGTTYLLRLQGDTSTLTRPGQFVNISVAGFLLRRPISVADYKPDEMLLVYEVVGHGTERMAEFKPGDEMDILSGLGNGFDPEVRAKHPLLIGGGIGVAPLYGLAKALLERGVQPVAVLGYNNKEKVVMDDMFRDLGIRTLVATMDGSVGTKGFATDAIREAGITDGDYFYACGPMPMLKALGKNFPLPGELSLDVRMGCGFGACAGCAIKTTNGFAGVCKAGPVFKKDVVLWDEL